MRESILFIAMSLDGYIADRNGGVDWLAGQGNESETIDVYGQFSKDFDTVFMGWKTYNQVVTELSPEKWPYEEFTTYVFTHRKQESSEKICFTQEHPAELLKKLKLEQGKNIWICGGAYLAQQLIQEDLLDQYYISVIPAILGGGVRLFEETQKEIKLKLQKTQSYNGITDLIYTRR